MEAKDIDLFNLPEGTRVKIVDEWRKEGGMQNQNGDMDKYLGTILEIKDQNKTTGGIFYHVKDEYDDYWYWFPEFFEAIKLPNTDTWYKVIEKDGKYVITDYANGGILTNSVEAPTSCPEVKIYLPLEDNIGQVKEIPTKYLVFVSGKSSPKKAHDTYEKAEQEAKRLAEKEVGYLVSICKVEKQFISKIIVEEV